MAVIKIILNSFLFWGGWIIIPFIMEIVPALGSVILLIRRNRRHRSVRKEIKVFPEISLIIPVYNSADTLFQCIESINNSTYPNERIRIFLVNNKGQDNSFDVYADCQRRFPDLLMQWMNAEQGKSRALNLALYNSDGKYIINLDSDGVLEKNALVNMITKFEADTDLNCMTGAILTMPKLIMQYKGFFPRLLRNLEFMEYAQAFLAGRSYASEMNAVYTLSGAFSAFRKSAVLKSWMYNTDTICEDTHITFQMRYRQNERVEVCEDAIFFVDPIEDVNKLYTQRQRWQRGSLEVAKMFMDKDFKVKNILKNINVKTLLYDHTFAFPRMIWYLALICLMVMGYSGKVILLSTGIIFAMYIMIGFMYFVTVLYFLKIDEDTRRYYKRHWWCILFLPLFNFAVFFIRMAGIINSIQTDSSWRTRNLTDERIAFTQVVKGDFEKPLKVIRSIQKAVNICEPESGYDMADDIALQLSRQEAVKDNSRPEEDIEDIELIDIDEEIQSQDMNTVTVDNTIGQADTIEYVELFDISDETPETMNISADNNISDSIDKCDSDTEDNLKKYESKECKHSISLVQSVLMAIVYIVCANAVYLIIWTKKNVSLTPQQVIQYIADIKPASIFVGCDMRVCIVIMTMITVLVICICAINYTLGNKSHNRLITCFNNTIMYISVIALPVVVLTANYCFDIIEILRNWLAG